MAGPNKTDCVRLADGLIFVRDIHGDSVADVRAAKILTLSPEDLQTVARVCCGEQNRADTLGQLCAAGVLTQDKNPEDPILRQRLASLDALFMGAYLRTLSKRARCAYDLTLAAHARRKHFVVSLGQCPALPETALRRALLVGDADEVGCLDVLCVGDDDLVAIPLAALGHRVTVFDADPTLLDFLRHTSSALGLAVTVERCDLTQPLPASANPSFDLFIADPMSNEDCLALFLSRGFCLTRLPGRAFVAICGPARGRLLACAEKMGLRITAERARHGRYHTQYYKLHPYESDWVELHAGDGLEIPFPRDRCCHVPGLYREAIFVRPTTTLGYCQRVNHSEFDSNPEWLLRLLAASGHLTILWRQRVDLGRTSLLGAQTTGGFVTIRLDRGHGDLAIECFEPTGRLRRAVKRLMTGFCSGDFRVGLLDEPERWDLRVG